jgi:hypothetical protein
MAEVYKSELYRNEGPEFRSVRIDINEDGSLRLHAQDMGESVEKAWGGDDYEFWVDVPAGATRKLLFALLCGFRRSRPGIPI